MARFTAKRIKEYDVLHQGDDKMWRPTRPINYIFESFMVRIKLAYGVLAGKYDALDWEENA